MRICRRTRVSPTLRRAPRAGVRPRWTIHQQFWICVFWPYFIMGLRQPENRRGFCLFKRAADIAARLFEPPRSIVIWLKSLERSAATIFVRLASRRSFAERLVFLPSSSAPRAGLPSASDPSVGAAHSTPANDRSEEHTSELQSQS